MRVIKVAGPGTSYVSSSLEPLPHANSATPPPFLISTVITYPAYVKQMEHLPGNAALGLCC